MTVSSSLSTQTFTCDGSTTVFTCPFRVLEASEMVGYLITIATNESAQLVNGTDFAVTGVGASNAVATTTLAYSAAYQINFRRRTQRVQSTDYRDNDPFPAESHENALDRLTHIAQENDADVGRAILVPEPESGVTLPSATDRANLLLGFNSSGEPIAVAPTSGSAAALAMDLANTAAASKGAGQVGYSRANAYAAGTVGGKLREFFSVKDFGAVGNGIADDRAALQAAFDAAAAAGKRLLIPAGTYGITLLFTGGGNFGGIIVPSNICVEWEPGALFKLLAHNSSSHQILRIWGKTDITLIRPRIDGSKSLNAAVGGEFGMGISIGGGSNIHIISPVTYDCWGDGIYISNDPFPVGPVSIPTHVRIDGHEAYGCRRQGMSIISGNGVTVNDAYWHDIGTVSPSAGLDIEPDANDEELKAIRINNPRTAGNWVGIQVYLSALPGAAAKDIDVVITNHTDDGSILGAYIVGADTSGGTQPVRGLVSFVRPTWRGNSENALKAEDTDILGFSVDVDHPAVVNNNRSAAASPKYGAPFSILRDTGSVKTFDFGNVTITGASVTITSGSIPSLICVLDVPNGRTKPRNVRFLDPVWLAGISNAGLAGFFQGRGQISDRHNVWNYQLAGSITLDTSITAPLLAAATSMQVTLESTASAGGHQAGSPDIIIRQLAPDSCNVATAVGGNFVGLTVGQRYQMIAAAGSYIRLTPIGSNVWSAVEKAGLVGVV